MGAKGFDIEFYVKACESRWRWPRKKTPKN